TRMVGMATRSCADGDRRGHGHRAILARQVDRAVLEGAYALRVAIAGDTEAARRAGPSTASWPSSHSAIAPMGRYASGSRGSSYLPIRNWLRANANIMPSAMPAVVSRKFSVWK